MVFEFGDPNRKHIERRFVDLCGGIASDAYTGGIAAAVFVLCEQCYQRLLPLKRDLELTRHPAIRGNRLIFFLGDHGSIKH